MKKILRFLIYLYLLNVIKYYLYSFPINKIAASKGLVSDDLRILIFHPLTNFGYFWTGITWLNIFLAYAIIGLQRGKVSFFSLQLSKKHLVMGILLIILFEIFWWFKKFGHHLI